MILTLSLFHFFLVATSLFFLVGGVLKFVQRVKSQTFFRLMMTFAIWGGVLFFTLFPGKARELTMAFGLGENLNTLIFLVFVVIFIIIFRLLATIERLERSISEIVRNKALEAVDAKE